MNDRRWFAALGGVALVALLAWDDRWRRLIRALDQRSGIFVRRGQRGYGRAAARLGPPLYRRVAADVGQLIQGGLVLDVGAGPGLLALELARRDPSITMHGIDLSPAMVALARANARDAGLAGRVRFAVGDVAALPYPDGSVDLVVSTLSMHHWGRLDAALAEIGRVLRPGGWALLYDFDLYGRRELRAALAATPLVAHPIERTRVVVWHLPLLMRVAVRRAP